MKKDKPILTESQEVLVDAGETGKPRPWRRKKIRGLLAADSFKRLGQDKRAERIRDCGTFLEFRKEPETGRKHLTMANFCRERLCPMCQWRRSVRVFQEVSQVLDAAEEMSKGFVPLFLTLTLRNCRAETVELSKTLDAVFNGWYRFTHHRKIRNTLAGWFRSLELTYNEETDTFHPHIHILLFVDKSYFKAGCYMETTEWVRLWRVSLRLDYDPICDIRRVKNSEERRTEIAEVAKYTVKDTEIFTHKKARTDRLVSVLSVSLKGRRLYAFGGLLKRVRADILAADPDERDGTIRGDIATVIERYKWVFGISNYMRVDLLETTENQAEKLCLSDATER